MIPLVKGGRAPLSHFPPDHTGTEQRGWGAPAWSGAQTQSSSRSAPHPHAERHFVPPNRTRRICRCTSLNHQGRSLRGEVRFALSVLRKGEDPRPHPPPVHAVRERRPVLPVGAFRPAPLPAGQRKGKTPNTGMAPVSARTPVGGVARRHGNADLQSASRGSAKPTSMNAFHDRRRSTQRSDNRDTHRTFTVRRNRREFRQ